MIARFQLKDLHQIMNLMGRKSKYLFYGSCLISSLNYAASAIIMSQIYKHVINGVMFNNQPLFYQSIVLAIIFISLISIVTPISSYLSMYISKKSVLNLRTKLANHLMRLPITYFDKHPSGEILSHLTSDLAKVESIYDREFYGLLQHFLTGFSALIIICRTELNVNSF